MKIECTENQKKVLINIVRNEADLCPFAGAIIEGCATATCPKCFEDNVEWTIIKENKE